MENNGKCLSISMSQGTVALTHNRREHTPKNADANLSKNNVYIKTCSNLEKTFNEIFENDVANYNEKQTRSDRQIKNYYQKIHSSEGKENTAKTCYEYVFGFGNMNDNNVAELGENESVWDSRNMLLEFEKAFEQKYPNLKVVSAVIHLDEQTPHLHLDFVPVATGYKKGMQHQCSLTKALENLGFVKTEKLAVQNWQDDAKQLMTDILNKYGYEREYKNNTEKHLSVDKFKLLKENEELLAENEINQKVARESREQAEYEMNRKAKLEKQNDEFVASLTPAPTKTVKSIFGEKEVPKTAEELERDKAILSAQSAIKHAEERERACDIRREELQIKEKQFNEFSKTVEREARQNEIERKSLSDERSALDKEKKSFAMAVAIKARQIAENVLRSLGIRLNKGHDLTEQINLATQQERSDKEWKQR